MRTNKNAARAANDVLRDANGAGVIGRSQSRRKDRAKIWQTVRHAPHHSPWVLSLNALPIGYRAWPPRLICRRDIPPLLADRNRAHISALRRTVILRPMRHVQKTGPRTVWIGLAFRHPA